MRVQNLVSSDAEKNDQDLDNAEPEEDFGWDPSRIRKGTKTILGYVSALCSLYNYQKTS